MAAATSADNIEDYTQGVFLHLAEDGWRRLFQWKGLFAESTDNPQSLASFLKTATRRKVIDLYRADHPGWLEILRPEDLPEDGSRAAQPDDNPRVAAEFGPEQPAHQLDTKRNHYREHFEFTEYLADFKVFLIKEIEEHDVTGQYC